jgi:hypothetical protein
MGYHWMHRATRRRSHLGDGGAWQDCGRNALDDGGKSALIYAQSY